MNVGVKVEEVGDKVEDIGDKVEEIGNKVEDMDDKVQCVDEKLQVVIDGASGLSGQRPIPSNIYTFRRQASKSRGGGNKVGH